MRTQSFLHQARKYTLPCIVAWLRVLRCRSIIDTSRRRQLNLWDSQERLRGNLSLQWRAILVRQSTSPRMSLSGWSSIYSMCVDRERLSWTIKQVSRSLERHSWNFQLLCLVHIFLRSKRSIWLTCGYRIERLRPSSAPRENSLEYGTISSPEWLRLKRLC